MLSENRIASWCALIALAGLSLFSEIQAHRPNSLSSVATAGPYRAEVFSARRPLPTGVLGWWGATDRSVTCIKLTKNGRSIHVPASAWGGLSAVGEVKLQAQKNGCTLRIRGGQTDSDYTATIVARGDVVVSRTVRDGEFPNEDFETTSYHHIPEDGR